MHRDIQQLSEKEFDVLIIGAGIYGATVAWEAASRGFSVAIIDQDDFGARTSSNSLKTIHGGLRYLQTLDLKRVFESVRERKIMLRIAPHLVHTLPVVMPTMGHMMKGVEALWAGLLLNDILSCTRNAGMDPDKYIPMGRVMSKDACLSWLPGIPERKVSGAAYWTDAQMYSSDRMLLAFLKSAISAGAIAANYMQCVQLLSNGKKVYGIEARDVLHGKEYEIKAKLVINASGGWVDKVTQNGSSFKQDRVNLSTAMNLVINREFFANGNAAGVNSRFLYDKPDGTVYRGKRVLFMSPWRKFTIAGTFHKPFEGHPDALHVSEEEIESAIEEINRAYPGSTIARDDVTFVHKGFLPMSHVHPKSGEVQIARHYKIYDHSKENDLDGLVSIVGVKYTTARYIANKVIDLAASKLNKAHDRSKTHLLPLAGGDIHRFRHFMDRILESDPFEFSPEVVKHLIRLYGTQYPEVFSYVEENSKWGELVPGSHEVIQAEVIHAVQNEMARKLKDVVLRRTDLGSGKHPGQAALNTCARLMADQLGWDKKRIKVEIEETDSVYRYGK